MQSDENKKFNLLKKSRETLLKNLDQNRDYYHLAKNYELQTKD